MFRLPLLAFVNGCRSREGRPVRSDKAGAGAAADWGWRNARPCRIAPKPEAWALAWGMGRQSRNFRIWAASAAGWDCRSGPHGSFRHSSGAWVD
jgi:hypothetical protein